MAITLLMLCAHGCATTSPTNDLPLPPLPDYRVLAELDAHDLTPDSAPHTWEFMGRLFRYHDIVRAMSE